MKFQNFTYRSKELFCENTSIKNIIQSTGTPVYIYSKATLESRITRLRRALDGVSCQIYFAVKACPNIHLLKLLKDLNCGADIVSQGELKRALHARMPPSSIVFSGVGKTNLELTTALRADIGFFNAESLSELHRLNQLAASHGLHPQVSLRVNPDVDAKTHPYISTGLRRNKFGLSKIEIKEICKNIKSFSHLNFVGLSCHIGSQIMGIKPLETAWKYLLSLAPTLPFQVKHLDLGGGLGISYQKEREITLEQYAHSIVKIFKNTPYALGIEPGRSLVGPAGILVSSVIALKNRGQRRFAVIDAGMNDLMRPALYNAVHPAVPISQPCTKKRIRIDIVGPVCESSDCFEEDANLPPLQEGDLIALKNTGAYGMSMASQYNSRPRPPEVLVEDSQFRVIRKRETYDDLISHEIK